MPRARIAATDCTPLNASGHGHSSYVNDTSIVAAGRKRDGRERPDDALIRAAESLEVTCRGRSDRACIRLGDNFMLRTRSERHHLV
jgi:hypothetical protein